MNHRSLIALLVLPGSFLFSQNGTYDFLRLDIGARAAALNGSFVSMTNDPNVLFYNPAALSTMSRQRASAGYLNHLLDVNAGSLAWAGEIDGLGAVGTGVAFVGYGEFEQTDASGNTIGSFGAQELAWSVGMALPAGERTAIGLAGKFISSSIAGYRSAALAVDAGVLYTIPEENITLGAAVRNLGSQLTPYAATREHLPLDLTIGITKRPEHLPVYLNLNFHKLNEEQEDLIGRFAAFSFGAEFLMSESVRFRVGYDNEKRKELKLGTSAGLAGFSLGGGLLVRDYQIDYAFNSYGKIGSLHRFSVGLDL